MKSLEKGGSNLEVTNEQLEELVRDKMFDGGVIKFGGDINLDLAVSMDEINIDTLDSEVLNFKGVKILTITLKQLHDMKATSLGPKDQEDVMRILQLKNGNLR